MKKLLLPFLLSFIIAGELEVDGNLKVIGNIDAQNQAIKNVGVPQELTDAINGNVLQDALRDDTNYELKLIFLALQMYEQEVYSLSKWYPIEEIATGYEGENINNFTGHVTSLFNDGWKLDSINEGWWIFKRPLDE